MERRRFDAFVDQGLLKERRSPFLEHLTRKGKRAWSQVQQQMFPLDQIDPTKAQDDCERCNGTGIIRHAKIGGVLTTIICSCLEEG